MDRSFLSKPDVIEASRNFVCVRLATYEDPEEAIWMKSMIRTRSGEVENSMFCIFAPDGETKLTRSARSMKQIYSDAAQMCREMNRLVGLYPKASQPTSLPLVANLRLALDIAAADHQPLLVLLFKDAEHRQKLEQEFSRLAWSKEWVGKFVYVMSNDRKELKSIAGIKADSDILLIQPDQFGTQGKVLAQSSLAEGMESVEIALARGEIAFRSLSKSHQNHVREGHQQGMFWETKIPVSDPEERQARERGKMMKRN